MDFKNLQIDENLIKILNKNGIKSPTEIQQKAIPIIKNNQSVIGEAQTGTGKTLAFLIPIIEKINLNKKNISCLILTPTRELAIQIANEVEKLLEYKNVNVLSCYGGRDISSQAKKLQNSVNIVIATPGRLLDHLNRKTIDLSKIETLILDEADEMLFMGFKNDIEKIMTFTPKNLQMLCFSATMDSKVKKLAYRYIKDPVVISTKKENVTLDNITQEVVFTTDREKQNALISCLKEDNPFLGIIFCRTKARVDKLEMILSQNDFLCEKLHSDIKQSKRERIMKSFKEAKIQYLVATDVAARGIDITGVSHIYNYDIPENVESYIHRIGRCGRNNEKGYTCLFVTDKDKNLFDQIQQNTNQKLKERNKVSL